MAYKGEDIVLGYNLADAEFVTRLAGTLRDEGLSVWFADPSGESTSWGQQKTQAILACKVFIPLLSEESVVDKQLQEHLSLAYVSNSCIFPLGLVRHRFLAPKLSGGAKLILAKINWCFVLQPDDYNKNVTNLIQCITIELKRLANNTDVSQPPTTITTHGVSFNLTHGLDLGGSAGYEGSIGPAVRAASNDDTVRFWDRHFAGKTSVKWSEFKEKFLQDYSSRLEEMFPDKVEERKKFLVNLMHKDVFNFSSVVEREAYEAFCAHRPEGANRFFNCLNDLLLAYMSLREVIGMDSSVRITTIQSLGKFSFPGIVAGLAELLKDEDANIRAVAAIALAHADAVDYIVDRWRNDPISTVREAAELALSKMNVTEAQRCIRVTQILSSEMSALKPKS
ncbi:hypothetical protein BaRGS_00025349 [Batillaria attramentaria]|uniref:TIR domain-containing protein n=1 Tax=Batillaria attramentaria TaxID=370345 RepID=A0ABD0K8L3_9CAEN